MSGLGSALPERKRSYRFALTPLADAMFQLLIFFMLSTSLTPYSLITLRTASEPAAENSGVAGSGDAPASQPAARGGRVTLWTLGSGTVTTGGQTYETDQLPDLAEALGSQDDPGAVVLIIGTEARVQDVATAMQALRGADVSNVQITDGGG
jgi:biopolymer transport protein ExbD